MRGAGKWLVELELGNQLGATAAAAERAGVVLLVRSQPPPCVMLL